MKNEAKNNGQGVAGTTGTARTIGALLRSGALLLLLLVAGCGEVEWFPDYERSATTPDDFAFTAKTGTAKAVEVTSNSITVAGLTAEAPISITGSEGGNSKYTIDGGTPTAAAGKVNNGATVTVIHLSAHSPNTATESTLTIGSVSAKFVSTTTFLDFTDPVTVDDRLVSYRRAHATITTGAAGTHVIGIKDSVQSGNAQYAVTNNVDPMTSDWKSGTETFSGLNGRRIYVRNKSTTVATPATTTLTIDGVDHPVNLAVAP